MDAHKDLPDLTPEDKLKIENDLLKAKLTAELGMMKSDSVLDDEAENQWLNYIYDYEKKFDIAARISIYEFIGKPEFRIVDKLNKEEIKSELDRLNAIMYDNEIVLDVLCDYKDEDELIYKFVTEEFFSEEIDDIRIKGMRHRFIYEEYHTNHEYDLTYDSEEFIYSIFERDWDIQYDRHRLHESIEFKKEVYGRDTFMEFILTFQNSYKPLEIKAKDISKVEFDLENGKAEVTGYLNYDTNSENNSGDFRFQFINDDLGYWIISGVKLPNFGN